MTRTPWGPSQTADTLADGIMDYTTASHGGIHLSDTRRAALADALGVDDVPSWYEEDCDWAIPYYVFGIAAHRAGAADTLRAWHPDIARALGLDIPQTGWTERYDARDHRTRCAMCRASSTAAVR